MSRSELRTRDGWASYDRWSVIIGILLLLLTALLYFMNRGKPGYEDCCKDKVAAAAPVVAPVVAPAVAPVVAPAPAPVVAPEPAKVAAVEPVKVEPVAPPVAQPAAPVVDCGKIIEGVTINFVVNGSALTAEGRRALDQVAKCLTANKYEVAGHTDSDGSDEYNQKLSERRAGSVVSYLTSKSIAAGKIVAAGYGEKKPVADNNTADGKAKNRRITFTPQ